VCLTATDSAPGGHTDMRLVSLEPVGPERGTESENLLKKWTDVKLPKKVASPMLLYGKIERYLFVCLNATAIKVLYFPVLWMG
jgi:hypothetical protein